MWKSTIIVICRWQPHEHGVAGDLPLHAAGPAVHARIHRGQLGLNPSKVYRKTMQVPPHGEYSPFSTPAIPSQNESMTSRWSGPSSRWSSPSTWPQCAYTGWPIKSNKTRNHSRIRWYEAGAAACMESTRIWQPIAAHSSRPCSWPWQPYSVCMLRVCITWSYGQIWKGTQHHSKNHLT